MLFLAIEITFVKIYGTDAAKIRRIKLDSSGYLIMYRIDPKYLDRQSLAKSVDRDQTPYIQR